MEMFNVSKESIYIGQKIISGILLEVSCAPSPGLVSPACQGSHKDMNFFTFMLSTSSIAPYFSLCAQLALDWNGQTSLLDSLRSIGKIGEEDLLFSTSQVNTQRGILFLGGIVAAAAGLSLKNKTLNLENICNYTAFICKGITRHELESLKKNNIKTKGESLYIKYGIKGIREEVENGLPSIKNISYPKFKDSINSGLGLNASLLQTLLYLISEVQDTTIISRLGMEGLKLAQDYAKSVINLGGLHTKEGQNSLLDMNEYFIKKNISPGGSADLLAITASIYLLEEKKFLQKDILNNTYS